MLPSKKWDPHSAVVWGRWTNRNNTRAAVSIAPLLVNLGAPNVPGQTVRVCGRSFPSLTTPNIGWTSSLPYVNDLLQFAELRFTIKGRCYQHRQRSYIAFLFDRRSKSITKTAAVLWSWLRVPPKWVASVLCSWLTTSGRFCLWTLETRSTPSKGTDNPFDKNNLTVTEFFYCKLKELSQITVAVLLFRLWWLSATTFPMCLVFQSTYTLKRSGQPKSRLFANKISGRRFHRSMARHR